MNIINNYISKLTQEEIENRNRLKISKTIKLIMQKLSKSSPESFIGKLYQSFAEVLTPVFYKRYQKTEEE